MDVSDVDLVLRWGYAYSLDELAKEPPTPVQLTASRKSKTALAFTPDSKEVYFLEGGSIVSTPIEQPKLKPQNRPPVVFLCNGFPPLWSHNSRR